MENIFVALLLLYWKYFVKNHIIMENICNFSSLI